MIAGQSSLFSLDDKLIMHPKTSSDIIHLIGLQVTAGRTFYRITSSHEAVLGATTRASGYTAGIGCDRATSFRLVWTTSIKGIIPTAIINHDDSCISVRENLVITRNSQIIIRSKINIKINWYFRYKRLLILLATIRRQEKQNNQTNLQQPLR